MDTPTRLCNEEPCRNTAHPDCANHLCVECCDMLCEPSECARASESQMDAAVVYEEDERRLRDEFAKAALIGLLSSRNGADLSETAAEIFSDAAYKYADAMMKRRSQT